MKRPQPIKGFKKLIKKRGPAINEVIRETTAGGVVWRRNKKNNEIEILFIQDAKNRWTIPKGHIEPGENARQTAEREIMEETGLKEVKVMNWLGKINFRYRRFNSLILNKEQKSKIKSNYKEKKEELKIFKINTKIINNGK